MKSVMDKNGKKIVKIMSDTISIIPSLDIAVLPWNFNGKWDLAENCQHTCMNINMAFIDFV